MTEPSQDDPAQDQGAGGAEFGRKIRRKGHRRLRARREGERDVSFWLGMFGLVGWSVALPIVVMIAFGVWIDARFPSAYSWTLMLLFVGVVIGCVNAWYWIRKESDDD